MSSSDPSRERSPTDLREAPAALVEPWYEHAPFRYPPPPVLPPALPDPDSQRAVREAYKCLDASDPGAALLSLEGMCDHSVIVRSAKLVAKGLLAEARSEDAEAENCFDEVLRLGVPSPTLLACCGHYFERQGRLVPAYTCFSMVEHVTPGTLAAFLRSLPAADLGRFVPAIVPDLLTRDRPNFFALHPAKHALVSQYAEEGTALLLGQLLGQPRPWHAARLELRSLQEHAIEQGLVYEELAGPKPVQMTDPTFLGEDSGPPIVDTTRTFFFSILRNVVVPSKSNFLFAGDDLLMDYQGEELTLGPLWFDLDPAVLVAEGRRLTVLRHDESGRLPPLEEALSLVGMYTWNFAHFIVEKLFKVLACIGRPGFESVPILIDEQMQPAHREMLELFLGPEHPIVVLPPGDSVQVSRLWALSSPIYWPGYEVPGSRSIPYFEVADVEFLAKLLRRAEPTLAAFDEDERNPRVFLTRSDHRLANREEIEERFVELGWLIVDAAELPLAEQVRLIRSAQMVAAITGSAMYGLFFARPSLRVGLLCGSPYQGPPHDEWQFYHEMMRQLGHRLLLLPGTAQMDSVWPGLAPFHIEGERILPFLEQLEVLKSSAE